MADTVRVTVNGIAVTVNTGTIVAAAVAIAEGGVMRASVSGQPRGPVCGMGICFECRAMVNGEPHQRGCQTFCSEGMEICTR